MISGIRPHEVDIRDLSFSRTFPLFGTAPARLDDRTYSYDVGLTMPDQRADGYPEGCTGYAQTDIKGDEDGVEYDAPYTYIKTCLMEGHAVGEPCDIRASKKSLRVYGALKKGEAEAQALAHRGLPYFNVDKSPGRDWFDSMRLALRGSRRGISVGTIWFMEWQMVNSTGILTDLFVFNGDIHAYAWHNYAVIGEKIIANTPYLIVKSWQGRNYGDHGLVYMDRSTFNRAFDMYGTVAFVDADAEGNDVQMIVLDIQQTILTYLNRLLGIIGMRKPIHA